MKKLMGILIALAAGFAAYVALLRPRVIRWGITETETQRSFPGDDFTPDANLISTHAITINAPASTIWPWLVQIGNGRAGWYSYRFVERLVDDGKLLDDGASYRILPEFQDLQAGDYIPVGDEAFKVIDLQPEHHLLLQPGYTMPTDPPAESPEAPTDNTTGFALILEPIDAHTTRLIARVRITSQSLLAKFFTVGFFEPGHFIMQTKMLCGIKQRAESNHRAA